MEAAYRDHADIATMLLKAGAKRSLRTKDGWLASEYADKYGFEECARIIKEYVPVVVEQPKGSWLCGLCVPSKPESDHVQAGVDGATDGGVGSGGSGGGSVESDEVRRPSLVKLLSV